MLRGMEMAINQIISPDELSEASADEPNASTKLSPLKIRSLDPKFEWWLDTVQQSIRRAPWIRYDFFVLPSLLDYSSVGLFSRTA